MSDIETDKKKLQDAVLEERKRRRAKKIVDKEEQTGYEITSRPVSSIVRKPREEIFGQRFRKGTFTFIVGQGEVGKGVFSMDVIAKLTTGEPFPGEGSKWRDPITAMMCVVEDTEDEIYDRLEAAGADLDRVELVTGPPMMSGGLTMPSPIRLNSDAGALVKLAQQKKVEAFFIETMLEHIGDREGKTKVSTNNEADVRGALAPFRAVCREANLYGWALIHPRKSSGGDVSEMISGSAAFYNVPRLTLHVFKDPTDTSKNPFRLLASGKANNLPRRPPTYKFRIDPWDKNPKLPRITWGIEGKTLEDERDVEDIRQEYMDRTKIRKDVSNVKGENFLKTFLSSGMKNIEEIEAAAEKEGISKRTLERAKSRLNIVSVRENKFGGPKVLGWMFAPEEM